jgi:membrane-bound metal-dependent hydrolase YbcI (DUF457 family)
MPDPITHASLSLIFARHCFKDQKFLFVLAALSPDIDVFIGGIFILLSGPWPASLTDFFDKSLIFHPGLSAAIWFIPIYSLILSWVFRRIGKRAMEANFRRIYTLVLVGMLLHLGLDFLQTGNRPLWPLDLTAGLNILPYTPAGRFGTMMAAIGLLVLDSFMFNRRRLSREHQTK